MMKLKRDEQEILDGKEGPAKQKAMALLVKYAEGLDAVVARVPAVTEFDQDPTEVISTGDWVKVDADQGLVEITKRDL